jgi:hypothetical protein
MVRKKIEVRMAEAMACRWNVWQRHDSQGLGTIELDMVLSLASVAKGVLAWKSKRAEELQSG